MHKSRNGSKKKGKQDMGSSTGEIKPRTFRLLDENGTNCTKSYFSKVFLSDSKVDVAMCWRMNVPPTMTCQYLLSVTNTENQFQTFIDCHCEDTTCGVERVVHEVYEGNFMPEVLSFLVRIRGIILTTENGDLIV